MVRYTLYRLARTAGLLAEYDATGAQRGCSDTSAGIRSAMIFVRNQNGSHNPDEAMRLADFMDGVELLYESVNVLV